MSTSNSVRNRLLEDEIIKPIYDNVYGFVKLTEKEKNLLSSPYFQRLHFLKQNGLAHIIFPGANHTRFSHTLGVLYIVERIIQRIKSLNKIKIDYRQHQILRLAALLHDIGHYPLSHTIELSYLEYEYYKSIDRESFDPPEIERIKDQDVQLNTFLSKYNSKSDKYHHEKIGEIVIKTALKDHLIREFKLRDEDIDIICNLICGKNESEEFYLFSKIINSQLDADQMDYMLRDTLNTGINSTIRLDFLINNIDICNKNFNSSNGSIAKPTLCFNFEALQSIEQFLLAKYYWYTEILFYDKVYILNLIASRLFTYLLITENIIYDETNRSIELFQHITNPQKFFFFNDSFFWEQIKKILEDRVPNTPNVVKLLSEILIYKKIPKIMDLYDLKEKLKNDSDLVDFVSYSGKIKGNITHLQDKRDRFYHKFNHNRLLPTIIEHKIFKFDLENQNSGQYISNSSIDISKCTYKKCDEANLKKCTNYCRSINSLSSQVLNQFLFEIDKSTQIINLSKERENLKLKQNQATVDGNIQLAQEYLKQGETKEKQLRILQNTDQIDCKKLYMFRVFDFNGI